MERRNQPVTPYSRRTVLGAIGAGALFGASAAGTAGASTPAAADHEWGSALPEAEALLAGYAFEDGEYVFETGRDSLEVGDEVRFMTTTDDDGGSRWFHWECSPYEVSTVAVVCGDRIERFDFDDETSGRVDLRDRIDGDAPAIDAVEFGITVRWQVDFGEGEVPIPPKYWPDFLAAALGTTPGGATENFSTFRQREDVRVELLDDQFRIDGAEASLSFRVTGDDPERMHLACFERPGAFEEDEVEEQVLYDSVVDEFEPGEHTVSVPLPIPDSMSRSEFEEESDGTGSAGESSGEPTEGSTEESADAPADGSESADDSDDGTDESSSDDATDESASEDSAGGESTETSNDADASSEATGETSRDAGEDSTDSETDADSTDSNDAPAQPAAAEATGADETPGPGVLGALASVGGVGYLLARRADDE